MITVMKHIAVGKNLNTRWKRIANLKTQAKVLLFLQNNNIFDMEQLAIKIEQMYNQQYDVSKEITKVDRRLEKLNEHLAHS